MARTRPKSDRVLIEKPSSGNTAKVPISETGTVSSGISVARQLWRKMKTTMTTRTIASISVFTISCIPSTMGRVVSSETSYSRPGGKLFFSSAMVLLMPSPTSRALEPGVWKTAITPPGLPL